MPTASITAQYHPSARPAQVDSKHDLRPGTTLVEKRDTTETAKLVEPPNEPRFIPIVFNMRDKPGSHKDIWPFAKHLVGDMDFAAFGVASGWMHVKASSLADFPYSTIPD
jgi:hypothetical protein